MVATRSAGLYGPEALLDDQGRPIRAVPVSVYTVDASLVKTATLATLYSKLDRSATITNPLPQEVADGAFGLDHHGNASFLADVDFYWLQWTQSAVTVGKLIQVVRSSREPTQYGGDWSTGLLWPAGSLVNVPGSPATQWLARRDVAPSSTSPAAGADWAAMPPAGPKGDPGQDGRDGVDGTGGGTGGGSTWQE